ncbi:MAG: hypothetical protein HKN76_15245 [Saprospiraceae bacterium]|nr:hypothetical protein [Saprospiraceae bacterium]
MVGILNKAARRIYLVFMVTSFIFMSTHFSWAQKVAFLTIENQMPVGTDYYFDIYLTRSSDIILGDIYLGHADFIIAFNQALFNNPTLTKVNPSPGNCTFQPTVSDANNDLITRANYFDNSVPMIMDDLLVINLNGPSPGDQITFNTRVAKIDDAVSMHRLGTFKISGLVDPNSDPDLKWKTKGTGLTTKVSSLVNISPFTSGLIDLETDTNTCPDSLGMSIPPLLSGQYQAAVEITLGAAVQAGATITLTAGNHFECLPNFAVPLGTTVEMSIQGCQ